MPSLRLGALSALVVAALAATPASAGTPESGSLGPGSQTFSWTGATSDPTGTYELLVFFYGETSGTCNSLTCDTETINVADVPGADTLTITVASNVDAGVAFEVTDPGGKVTFVDDSDVPSKRTKSFPAKAGAWTVQSFGSGTTDFKGTATLGAAPADPSDPGADPATPAAPAPKLTVSASSQSAKKLKKAKKFAIGLKTSAPLTDVTATLVKSSAPTKPLAKGSLAKLEGSAKVTLKISKALKAGKYQLLVAGTDSSGQRASAKKSLTVKK